MHTKKQQRGIYITLIVLFGIIAFVVGLLIFQQKEADKQTLADIKATVLTPPRAVAPFNLTYEMNKNFSNASLYGHWTFMFFGYTRCPDVCPTTMAVLNNAYETIKESGLTLPRVVFVSVDPMRDNSEYLQRYVRYFNEDFMGITGTEAQVSAFTKDLGVVYIKVTPKGEEYTGQSSTYLIDHSGVILLFNPQGNLRAVFAMPHDANQIASEYSVIINNK